MATMKSLRPQGGPITRRSVLCGATALGLGASLAATRARGEEDALRMAAARRWVVAEFTPSTLAVEEQMAEMAVFHSGRGAVPRPANLRRLGDAGDP